nr:hypothetical protein [Mycoplasmopsis bovis]
MTLSLATKDGKVSKEEQDYSARRADCAPLLISGGTYFDEFGQLFEYGYSAKSNDDIESLKKLAIAMKSKGNIAILQLAHAGKFSKARLKKARLSLWAFLWKKPYSYRTWSLWIKYRAN